MSATKSDKYVNDSGSDLEGEEETYVAPKNYHKYDLRSKFEPRDNREIWLIKTPKGFPIEKLQTLPVSFGLTSKNGLNTSAATFKVENRSFQLYEESFAAESEAHKYSILGHKGENQLEPVEKTIDRFYNISEKIAIPDINYEKVVIPRKDVEKIDGLVMKHYPTGYGASDFEEARAPKRTASHSENGTHKKRKTESESGEKEKKEKKDKKEKKEMKEKKEKKEKKDKKDKKEKKEKN